MDNPEKLATQGTQDEDKQNEDKQNKSTTQYVLDTTTRKQDKWGRLSVYNRKRQNYQLCKKVHNRFQT